MKFLDAEFVKDLRALTPADLREVAAYVRKLRLRPGNPFPPNPDFGVLEYANQTTLPDFFLTLEAHDLRVIDCDQAALAIFGSKAIGQSFLKLIHPDDHESAERSFAIVYTNKEAKNVRLHLLPKSGISLPVTMAARWVDTDNQTGPLIDIVCRDISHFKRIGAIEIFSEMLSIGVLLVDEQGLIAFANSSAEKMFGYEIGELECQAFERLLPGAWADFAAQNRLDFREGDSFHPYADLEAQGQKKLGAAIVLKIGLSPIRIGNHWFAVITIADITERRRSEERARAAEDRFRTALHFSTTVLWLWDAREDVTEWFGQVLELIGRQPPDLSGMASFRQVVYPADLPGLESALADCLATGHEFYREFRIERPDGEIRWLAGRGRVVRDTHGEIYGLTGVNFDITDRKSAEEEVLESERNFRQLTNVLPQIVFTANSAGVIDYRNERFCQISGLSAQPPNPIHWTELLSVEDRQETLAVWQQAVDEGAPFVREVRIWDRLLAQNRWNRLRAIPVRNNEGVFVRWIGTFSDIHDHKTAAERLESEVASRTSDLNRSLTLLRQREEQLEKSLQEKDALLREIHHRVKNNLQIISSLLSMQAATATGPAVGPLRDSERRIASMALIHEQLYGTDDMQTVEFGAHAHLLFERLMASLGDSAGICCKLDLAAVNLTIHQAIPCALILNELLTNAFKYAYPQKSGEISVHLSRANDLVTMSVSDQGAGLPSEVDPFEPKTLGLQIVNVLVQQLDGELKVAGPPGAMFAVLFRQQQAVNDVAMAKAVSVG